MKKKHEKVEAKTKNEQVFHTDLLIIITIKLPRRFDRIHKNPNQMSVK